MIGCEGCTFENVDGARFCARCGTSLGAAGDFGCPIESGTVFEGKYSVVREIGRGGMGVVYEGRDLALDRQVAIKVLPEQFNTAGELVARFQVEARAMASLDHPNVIPIYAIGQQGRFHYFVMKYLAGETVAVGLERLARVGQCYSLGQVRRVVVQACDALAHAHDRGLVHRDIKPGNIMLGVEDHVTIMDFGLVMQRKSAHRLTKSGIVYGTPEYMAPEQAQGRVEPGPAADLYSLGIVAYEMLSGELPFTAPTPFEIVSKHIKEAPPRLIEAVPGMPEEMEAVVLRALAKKPGERFPGARAMRDAMAAVVPRPVPGPGPQVMELRRRRRPRRVAINCEFRTLKQFATEYATDISTNGCFIHSRQPLPVGALVSLRFTVLDDGMTVIEGEGEVVRVVELPEEPPGMGVRFTDITDESVTCIHRLVELRSGPH